MTDFEKDQFWAALGRLYDTALELTKSTRELRVKSEQDGEHIRSLVRIAEIHAQRLTDLEGPRGQQ